MVKANPKKWLTTGRRRHA